MGGHEEICQDSLANAAKHHTQEQVGNCSAARTTSTTVQIKSTKTQFRGGFFLKGNLPGNRARAHGSARQ